jgi:uncharacterized membrane protein
MPDADVPRMMTFVVHGLAQPFEFQLTEAQVERWRAMADARGQTLDESFNEVLQDALRELREEGGTTDGQD